MARLPFPGTRGAPVLLALLAVPLLSCDDGRPLMAPTAPDLEVVGAPPIEVATLELEPASLELVTWEEATIEAKAYDADGNAIPADRFKVDRWEVVPDAALESKKDQQADALEITALAEAETVVTVTARSDDAEATAEVRILPVRARVTIIDSTALRLISTSEELEAGTYIFDVLRGPAPELETGDIISGDQSPTFLRAVESVQGGSPLVVETGPAELTDVFKGGAKAKGGIGGIRAGPKKMVKRGRKKEKAGGKGFDYDGDPDMAVAAAASPGDFSLSALGDLCKTGKTDWGGEAGVCAGVSVTGSVDAELDLDVDLDVSLFDPPEFDLAIAGGAAVVLDYEATLDVSGKVTIEKEVWTPWTRVVILGIPGKLRVGTVPGLEVEAKGEFTFSHGFDGWFDAWANVEYDGDWKKSSGWDYGFNWHDPGYETTASASAKLYLETQIELRWAGTKTVVKRGPWAEAAVTAIGEHLVHDGTLLPLPPPLNARATIGYSVGASSKVKILGISAGLTWEKPVVSLDVFNWWGQGRIELDVETTGEDPDPSGYTLVATRMDTTFSTNWDPPTWDRAVQRAVPANADGVTLERSPSNRSCMKVFPNAWRNCDLTNEWHWLETRDVMWNCAVQGDNPQPVHLHPFVAVESAVEVQCVSVFVALAAIVDDMVADGRIANAGLGNALASHLENGDAARKRGSTKAASRMMDAFIHLVEATSDLKGGGKARIEHDAAVELVDKARQIQDGYI